MTHAMNEQHFAKLAETYGASLARWPENVRRPARHFLQEHGQSAQALLDAQSDVDAALALLPEQKPDMALQARVLRRFDESRLGASNPAEQAGWLAVILAPFRLSLVRPAWGMALALLLIFGFVGGYAGYDRALDKTGTSALLANAFGGQTLELYGEDKAT